MFQNIDAFRDKFGNIVDYNLWLGLRRFVDTTWATNRRNLAIANVRWFGGFDDTDPVDRNGNSWDSVVNYSMESWPI